MQTNSSTHLGSGHRQLLDTQCSGLGAAWRRAALQDQREHPDDFGAAPVARQVATAVGAATTATVLLSWALWLVLATVV